MIANQKLLDTLSTSTDTQLREAIDTIVSGREVDETNARRFLVYAKNNPGLIGVINDHRVEQYREPQDLYELSKSSNWAWSHIVGETDEFPYKSFLAVYPNVEKIALIHMTPEYEPDEMTASEVLKRLETPHGKTDLIHSTDITVYSLGSKGRMNVNSYPNMSADYHNLLTLYLETDGKVLEDLR